MTIFLFHSQYYFRGSKHELMFTNMLSSVISHKTNSTEKNNGSSTFLNILKSSETCLCLLLQKLGIPTNPLLRNGINPRQYMEMCSLQCNLYMQTTFTTIIVIGAIFPKWENNYILTFGS